MPPALIFKRNLRFFLEMEFTDFFKLLFILIFTILFPHLEPWRAAQWGALPTLLNSISTGYISNYLIMLLWAREAKAWMIPAWIWDLFRKEVKNEEKIRLRSTDQQLLLGHFILGHFIFKLFALRHLLQIVLIMSLPSSLQAYANNS